MHMCPHLDDSWTPNCIKKCVAIYHGKHRSLEAASKFQDMAGLRVIQMFFFHCSEKLVNVWTSNPSPGGILENANSKKKKNRTHWFVGQDANTERGWIKMTAELEWLIFRLFKST